MRLIASDLSAERGGRTIFTGLSLTLEAGGLTWLAGPNGSGKSTLLRLLAGLLVPAAGSIRLDPAKDAPIGDFAHYLGHLDGLKPSLTVTANLAFWRRLSGAGKRSAAEALDLVGLGHLADLPGGYLSAGQRRRLAIARLLVSDRPIWLLDEPTTALDTASEARFGAVLAAHLAEGGMVIAASHAPLPVAATQTLALGGRA